MRVLAVDPGVATGMAEWRNDEFRSWQLDDPEDVLESVWDFCEEFYADPDVDVELVVEDFRIAGARGKTEAGIRATIELIGAIKFIASWHAVPVRMQTPADAKTFSTNDKLRRAGFETPSKPDHRRSAARHLLLRLVRTGAIDGTDLIR